MATCVCLAAQQTSVHVRNFDKVSDRIYRGGEPTAVDIEELGAMGVKTVLDLRLAGESTQLEKKEVEKLKIKYISLPLGEFGAPSDAQIEKALLVLRDSDAPVFVHCRRGRDRTGTVIACYRIEHDGWNNQRALAEAKEHGMSSFERAMRSYILHFTPLKLADVSKGGLQPPALP